MIHSYLPHWLQWACVIFLGITSSWSKLAASEFKNAGNRREVVKVHASQIRALACAHRQDLVASGEVNSGDIKLWSVGQKKVITTLQAPPRFDQGVWALAFFPDDQALIAAYGSYGFIVWDLTKPGKYEHYRMPEHVGAVAVAPDGKEFATAVGGRVAIWDRSTGDAKAFLHGPRIAVLSLAYSPDSKRLAAGDGSGKIKIWDIENESARTLKGHKLVVWSLAYVEDGGLLASASWDGTFALWNASTKQQVMSVKTDDVLTSVSYCEKQDLLAVGSLDGYVRLIDTKNKKQLRAINMKQGVNKLAFSPRGEFLVVGHGDEFDAKANQGEYVILRLDDARKPKARLP